MKEIASIAFNEGYKAAGCIGDPLYEREDFIEALFAEQKKSSWDDGTGRDPQSY